MLVCYFLPLPSFLARHHSRGIPSSSPIVSSLSNFSAGALFFAPYKSRPTCYHHLRDTLAPSLRADRSQSSRIGRVAIYCATVFCLFLMYFPVPLKPDSVSASSNGWYYQLPSPCLLICLMVSRRATLCWKLLRAQSILGVSTHVSELNKNTACVTALKQFPTPSDPPPPGSISATTSPNYYLPSEVCLPLQSIHNIPPSSPVPGI